MQNKAKILTKYQKKGHFFKGAKLQNNHVLILKFLLKTQYNI